MTILIDMTEEGTVEVSFIEYRPGEGLVVRVAGDPSKAVLDRLAADLNLTLRGSAHRLYRTCCDSVPGKGHLGNCENSLMRGGKGT